MSEQSFLQRLKERKLVQWAIAYLAGAWVVVQALDALETPLGLAATIQRAILVVLIAGFFVALVLAWFHGEKGRQRMSGPEFLIVTGLLVVTGAALTALLGEDAQTEGVGIGPDGVVEDDRPSIAVLPFQDLSPNPEEAYFAGAMEEEIRSGLSLIPDLRVVSRSSGIQYSEDRPGSRQIGDELGVRHLVEGSAQVSGGQVRLSVQLIDALRDEHLWAEDYDRDLNAENLFEVRSEVGQQIAYRVGVNLTPEQVDQISRVLTESTDAHLLFLQGKEEFFEERFRISTNFPSTGFFEQAIEIDPNFAPAHAHLALSLIRTHPNPDRYERAREEAELALSIMPSLAEARLANGQFLLTTGQVQEAMRQFKVAQAENPNSADAVMAIGRLQASSGDFEGSLLTIRRAQLLDPQNPVVLQSMLTLLVFTHRYDEALRESRKMEETQGQASPQFWYFHLLRGAEEEALAGISAAYSQNPRFFYSMSPGAPWEVFRRVLTPEQRRVAINARIGSGSPPCDAREDNYWFDCVQKAIHEEEVGSKELAHIYWDSLATAIEDPPPETWLEHAIAALAYQGLGRKEEAIQAAEALVSLNGARTRGSVEDHIDFGWRARSLLPRVLTHFGERDRAMDLLEELLPAPSWISVPVLEMDPIWDPLRSRPRFQALLEKYRDDVEQ